MLPEPLAVQVAGTPEQFGRGILAAHPGALLFALSAPANVIVVRVWPREGSELVYPVDLREWRAYGQDPREFATQRLGRGQHHLVLPVPSAYAVSEHFRSTPEPYRTPQRGFPRETCVLRPVAIAGPPPSRIYCNYLRIPDPIDPPSLSQWGPRPLDAHYLVVLAADTAFDLEWVRERIEEIDIAPVSGEVGAHVMAERLAGERPHWAAWIVRP